MPRRVSLPGAAELFRATPSAPHDRTEQHHPSAAASAASPAVSAPPVPLADKPTDGQSARPYDGIAERESPHETSQRAAEPGLAKAAPRGSGRVRHDEKITVYVSNDELLDLERARLLLRADHGMAVDRGRIVREALALAIGDLAERGADSDLVRRLSPQ